MKDIAVFGQYVQQYVSRKRCEIEVYYNKWMLEIVCPQ